MSTSLPPDIQAWLDREDAHTADVVRRHGVYISYVGGDAATRTPPFAYTTGMFGIGHPELAIVGADIGTASAVLNDVAARVRNGDVLVPGALLEFGDAWRHRVFVETVPNPHEIAFSANRFYDRPDEHSIPLLQLTYDDRAGRFPWQPGYANEDWLQPRPGQWRA